MGKNSRHICEMFRLAQPSIPNPNPRQLHWNSTLNHTSCVYLSLPVNNFEWDSQSKRPPDCLLQCQKKSAFKENVSSAFGRLRDEKEFACNLGRRQWWRGVESWFQWKTKEREDQGRRLLSSVKFVEKRVKWKNTIDHIESNHIEGIALTCNFCNQDYSSRKSLRLHKSRYHL